MQLPPVKDGISKPEGGREGSSQPVAAESRAGCGLTVPRGALSVPDLCGLRSGPGGGGEAHAGARGQGASGKRGNM